MDGYLKAAAQLFQQHGVDGFRIDAVKHLTWGWQYSLANSIYTYGDSFLFGEWFQGNTSDPLYRDSYKFANKSGISLLDFPLNTAIRNVFGSNANFSEIDSVISHGRQQLHLERRSRHLHRQSRHGALPVDQQ